MVEEGWYTDPQDSARLRYWDGAAWTEHTHDRPDDLDEPGEPAVEKRSPAAPTPPVAEQSTAAATRPVEELGAEVATSGVAAIKAPAAVRWSTEVRRPLDPAPSPSPQPPPPPPPAPVLRPPPTAETRPPPIPPEEPPPGPEPDVEPATPTAVPGRLNDVGRWLAATFRVGLAKLLPCAMLVVLGFVPAVFLYAVAYLALTEVADDGAFQGTTVVMFVVVGLLFVVWMLWVGVVTLAQNHLLYQAHVGGRTSIGRSLQAGFEGIGRLAWAYLALVVYGIVVVAVVGGLSFIFSLVSATLGSVFFVVAYLAALTLTVWLGVKLVFLVIAAAVAPPGERPLVVSVETTDGYFWAILGRLLLLGLILSAALVPVMFILGVLFGTSGTAFVTDPGSQTAAALVGTIAVGGVLYLLVTLATQVFSTSAIVRLYINLGGPAQREPSAPDGPTDLTS